MEYLKYIMPPLIGAVIGYVTNWIAVKMMFRPLKEIKIGKFKLPFTPGIIPKNRKRIAKSIAIAINDNLLTNSDLTDKLMSNDIQDSIREKVANFAMSDEILGNKILETVDRQKFNQIKGSFTNKLSNSIYLSILEANVGEIVGSSLLCLTIEFITRNTIVITIELLPATLPKMEKCGGVIIKL